MKRLLFIGIVCGLGSLAACTNKTIPQDTFVFEGNLSGADKKMAVMYEDTLQQRAYEEIELVDGKFRKELKIAEPQVVSVSSNRFFKTVGNGFIPCNSAYLMFVAQPGQALSVEGTLQRDFVDIYPGGDPENDIFREYTSAMHPVLNACVNLMVANQTDSTLSPEAKAANERQIREYDREMQDIRIAFLDKHISSVGGLWLLEDMLIRTQTGMDEAERYLKQVDPKYTSLTYYKNIAARVQGARATAIGQETPAIRTSRTYDGKPFNLEEWRGKYVLIDFWGTWCGACIAGMPEMKAFAAKHADKLMLLGIAQERDESTWRKYLSKSEWDWKQIISGEGDEDYILRFNVQGFPTKILVGPDGRILKRLVGEEPGFYVELEELMND